jgi:hypothetical protein
MLTPEDPTRGLARRCLRVINREPYAMIVRRIIHLNHTEGIAISKCVEKPIINLEARRCPQLRACEAMKLNGLALFGVKDGSVWSRQYELFYTSNNPLLVLVVAPLPMN